ncbi:MAG: 3-isopropylmalate dehydrogenase [Clostridia bacterium]
MKEYSIAVLKGDGIGPDVVDCTLDVLNAIGTTHGCRFHFTEALIGGAAIDATGKPLPGETLDLCRESHAVLLGAVGGPKWEDLEGSLRPEAGLLAIRSALGLFANLRPAVIYNSLREASPLNPRIIGQGIDILVIRELTGGAYFGKRGNDGYRAYDTMEYTVPEIERIAHVAFRAAMKRKKRLCSIDKANVLDSSRLWRATVILVARQYPEVELSHMYVDNAAMQLIRNPRQFDVIVTENLFGDILSDEAAMITGSIGLLPSASLSGGTFGLYEPVHGSAPDIAGKDQANPIATILSAAMMLRHSLGMERAACDIEGAVAKVLEDGYRTCDISNEEDAVVGTRRMGKLIEEALTSMAD